MKYAPYCITVGARPAFVYCSSHNPNLNPVRLHESGAQDLCTPTELVTKVYHCNAFSILLKLAECSVPRFARNKSTMPQVVIDMN